MDDKQIHKQHLTVAEAALLTGKSTSILYKVISEGKLPTVDTVSGMRVRTVDVLELFANRRRGRPRREPAA